MKIVIPNKKIAQMNNKINTNQNSKESQKNNH